MLRLFWVNGDKIEALLNTLTDKLPVAGTMLVNVGDFMIATSKTLTGGGPLPLDAQQSAADAAAAVDTGKGVIAQVATNIFTFSGSIMNIKVPVLTLEEKTFPVIGGLDFLETAKIPILHLSECDPFTTAGIDMGNAFTQLTLLDTHLANLRDNLSSLGQSLGQIGSDMNSAGELLKEIGVIFQQINA